MGYSGVDGMRSGAGHVGFGSLLLLLVGEKKNMFPYDFTAKALKP